MLVSKFGQLTAKLATKPSKAAAITKRKYSIRKPHVAEYAKTRPLSLYRTFRRSVSTLGDNIEEDVTHVRDLRGQTDAVQFLDGLPPSQAHRKVLIYKPTPKTVQQGTRHTQVYMKYQRNDSRVNERLMGWTSTTDPTGNLVLSFPDDKSAVAFAQRNGLDYEVVVNEGQERVREPRDYGNNFRFRDPRKSHNEDNIDL